MPLSAGLGAAAVRGEETMSPRMSRRNAAEFQRRKVEHHVFQHPSNGLFASPVDSKRWRARSRPLLLVLIIVAVVYLGSAFFTIHSQSSRKDSRSTSSLSFPLSLSIPFPLASFCNSLNIEEAPPQKTSFTPLSPKWRPDSARVLGVDDSEDEFYVCQQHIHLGFIFTLNKASKRTMNNSREIGPMIRSMLHHRTCNITFEIITDERSRGLIGLEVIDALGIKFFENAKEGVELEVKEKFVPPFRETVRSTEPGLWFRFHNISEHIHIIKGIKYGMAAPVLLKAFLDKVLPLEVDSFILVDLDMIFFGDICQLWRDRAHLPCTEARPPDWAPIQITPEMTNWYSKRRPHWKANTSKDRFGNIWVGLNSGLTVLSLNAMRDFNWTAKVHPIMTTKGTLELADQDVYVAIWNIYPELFSILPLEWNFQLVAYYLPYLSWKRSALKNYAASIKILHGNSGSFGRWALYMFCPLYHLFDGTRQNLDTCSYKLPDLTPEQVGDMRDHANLLLILAASRYKDYNT